MEEIHSKDGTAIPFERLGDGQPVIVVGGATCNRAMTRPPAEQLAQHFTVPATKHYDIFPSPALASTVAPFLDAPMPEVG